MKHSINLYNDSLKPKRELFSLTNLLLVVGLVLILALLMRGLYVWQSYRLTAEQQQISTELTTVRGQLTALAQQRRAQQPQRQIQQDIENLQQQVIAQQALARELERRAQPENINYARILRDLSAIHEDGLWLTRIENDQGQLVLSGQTVNSANLPRWMSRFNQVASLRGHQFAVVALERDDREVLNFELRSQRPAAATTRPPGARP